jgi:hypothetical protein
MKLKTAGLEGKALDYMVWLAERGERPIPGLSVASWAADYGGEFFPSSDWQQGGPIIERQRLEVHPRSDAGRGNHWGALPIDNEDWSCFMRGPTPLIAAMRAYVASKFGEEVEVPDGQ